MGISELVVFVIALPCPLCDSVVVDNVHQSSVPLPSSLLSLGPRLSHKVNSLIVFSLSQEVTVGKSLESYHSKRNHEIGIPSSLDISFPLSGSSFPRALEPPVPRTRESPLSSSIMAYPKPFPLASPPKPQQAAFAPDLSVRLICPDCRDPNPTIIEEFGAGDLVCGSCGLVLGDRVVDTRSEWRVRAFFIFFLGLFFALLEHPLSCHIRPSQTMKATTLLVSVLRPTLSWRA